MKRISNKKAFTLVEVLVAMGLLTLVVFVFTPLMLASLKSVKMSSDVRQEVAAGKTNVEIQLADGVDPNAGNVATIEFSQNGAPTTGAAAGDYVVNKANDRTLVGFAANSMPTMTVSPAEVLETNAGVGTQFLLYCDKLEFQDLSKFKLVNKNYSLTNSGVPSGVQVQFSAHESGDKHKAYMKVVSGRLNYYESVYKVLYDGMDAQITVHIVPLIAVGDNGTMLFKTNGAWPADSAAAGLRSTYVGSAVGNTASIRHIIWNGKQYVMGGTDGLWAYNTANSGWASKRLSNGDTTITGLAAGEDGTIYASGRAEKGWLFDVWYAMRQQLNDAASVETGSDSNVYKSLHYGTTVATGYTSKTGSEQAVWGYTFWSNPCLATDIGSYSSSAAVIDDSYNGQAMASNHKTGTDSEFLGSFVYDRDQNSMVLYQWKCGANRTPNITNGAQWEDVTSSSNNGQLGSVVRIHYYQLANYDNGNTIIKIEGGKGLQEQKDGNRYYVTYPTSTDRIYLVNGDLYQYEDVQTFIDGAKYTMTGVFNGIYSLEDVWSVGGEVTLARNTGNLVTVTGNKRQNLSKWAGNKFLSVSNDVKYFVDRTQITLSSIEIPLVYMDTDDNFYPAVLRTQDGQVMQQSQYADYRINAVNYIGGRLYAVGNGGLILSSLDGKDWTVERAYNAANKNLYSIAGTGEYIENAGG